MTLPSNSYYLVVDLDLIEMSSGDTQEWHFSNRPIVALTTEPTYATLLEVNGLDIEIGTNGMPVKASGSIVLKDKHGSIGEDRRFVDILQRWSPIDRTVTVRLVASVPGTEPSASDIVSGGTTIWTGRVTSWSRDYGSEEEELTLETEGISIRRTALGRTLTEAETNERSALGRVVPIVFNGALDATTDTGRASVPAYSSGTIDQDEVPGYSRTKYFWATALEGSTGASSFYYKNAGGGDDNRIWVRDQAGFYRDVSDGGGWFGDSSVGGTNCTAVGAAYYAVALPSTPRGLYIGGRMSFDGVGSAVTPAGNLNFELYGATSGAAYPNDERQLAKALVPKSAYHATLSGSSNFWVEWRWDRAVPVDYESTDPDALINLWIVFSMDQYTPGSDFIPTGPGAVKAARKNSAGVWGASAGGGTDVACCSLLSAVVGDDVVGPDNSGRSLFYKTLDAADPPSHATNPDLSQLDVIVTTTGIRDNDAGDITGTAYDAIVSPDHAIKLLCGEWTGTEWDVTGSSVFDESIFQTERDEALRGELYPRLIAGYQDGDANLDDMIEGIVKEHGLKLVPTATASALWAWGATYDPVFVFDDEMILVEDLECADKSTIVNAIELRAQLSILYAQTAAQLGSRGAGAETAPDFLSDGTIAALVEASQRTYGQNRNDQITLRWHHGAATTKAFAEYLARSFDAPEMIVTFSTAYMPERDLGLANTVEIVSTALPAYYGTSPIARKVSYSGTEISLADGPWVRADRYRAQLIAKSFEYNEDGIRLKYKARIIGSYHTNDPT